MSPTDQAAQSAKLEEINQGLAALDQVTQRYAETGADIEEVKGGVKSVRRKFKKVFTSIEVIDGGETWDYEYTYNPTKKKKGPKKKKIEPGSKENPFLLVWPKRPSANYPPLYFGGQIGQPRSQSVLKALHSKGQSDSTGTPVQKYTPHSKKKLEGSSETIGLDSGNRIFRGQVIGPLSEDSTPGGGTLNSLLAKYGFVPSDEWLDADHVKEIQFGGKDELGNMWPLDASENRGAGSALSKAQVEYPDSGKVTTIPQLKKNRSRKYFFKISGFNY